MTILYDRKRGFVLTAPTRVCRVLLEESAVIARLARVQLTISKHDLRGLERT